MAKTQVDVVFKGKDAGVGSTATKAGGALKKLESASAKSTKGMKAAWSSVAVGIGIAVLAVQQIKRAFSAMSQAYEKQVQAETKLISALKATGNAVGINYTEMKKMAAEMSNITAIGDEVIIEAQGIMTTFTEIGKDVFPDAIKAAADMSAMFGQDLQQSVVQLGTALNDPIAGVGRLKRIGISFSEDQKKSIAQYVEQNDLMSAQGVILQELQAEFGGVAAEMGATAVGSMKRFQNAIGDTMEELGGAMVEGIKPFLDEATIFLQDNQQKIGAIFRNIPGFAKIAFDTVVRIIKKALSFEFIGAVIVNFGKAFLENMITVAKALPELIWTALQVLTAPIRNFATWLGSIFEKVFADVANFFIGALNALPFVDIELVATKNVKGLGQVWGDTLKEMDTTFGKFSGKLGETMVDVGKNLLQATAETGKEFAPIIADAGKEFDALFALDKQQQEELEEIKNKQAARQNELMGALKEYNDAWSDVLATAEKFQDPLDKQEEELLVIQKRLLGYTDIFAQGTAEFDAWARALSSIDMELEAIQKKRNKFQGSEAVAFLAGGEEAVKLWGEVANINRSIMNDTEQQKLILAGNLANAEKLLASLSELTTELTGEQAQIRDNLVTSTQQVIDALNEQLMDLPVQDLQNAAQDLVNEYAKVYKTEQDRLKAREKALKTDMDTLMSYYAVLQDKIKLYEAEGRATEELLEQVDNLNNTADLLNDELGKVQKSIKDSTRDTMSIWDIMLGDISGIFEDFSVRAKQRYADKAGVDVSQLSADEESAAIGAGIVSAAMSGLASIVLWLVDELIALITSTEAWRNVMAAFQKTLVAVIEFAVVPLIEAITPLFTVIIALVAVIANILVPIFNMFGILIQSLMPLFLTLGRIVISVAEVLLLFLPPVLTIVDILMTALAPVLSTVAVLFGTLKVILEILNPVFELLAFVVRIAATPIAVLGAIIEWIGNILYNFGTFVKNMIGNLFNPSKWGKGMRSVNLGKMIANAVSEVWTGPEVSDFEATAEGLDIPDFTEDLVFGGDGVSTQFEDITPGFDGGGLYGGGTTVRQVPDINIHQHFHAAVIGEGGKEAVGEYAVEAIQEYLGVGGVITWLEETVEA